MAQNFWENDAIVAPEQAQQRPVFSLKPPEEPEGRYTLLTPEQAAAQGLDPSRRWQVSPAGQVAALGGEDGKDGDLTTNKKIDLSGELRDLDQFEIELKGLEDRFNRDFASQGLATPLEYLPGKLRPVNEDYNAASMRLIPFIAKALGFSAKQMDTPAEMKRLEAYVPMASDSDVTAKAKLARLREVLAGGRRRLQEQLGASDANKGQGEIPPPATDAQKPVEQPPGPGDIGFSGKDQGEIPLSAGQPPKDARVISETGEMRWSTERDKQYAAQLQQMFDSGASQEQINAFARAHSYPPPNQEELAQAIAYRDGTGPFARQGPKPGARIRAPESGYSPPSTIGAAAASPLGAYGIGAANALTAGGLDELVGVTGGDAEHAQIAKELAREEHPVASFVGETTGGVLAMTGVGRLPGMAGRAVAGDVAYGTAYGAGEDNENRLRGAAFGAAGAYAGNKAIEGVKGLGARWRARPASAEREAGREVIGAAERIGMTDKRGRALVMPADVGGAITRRLTSAAHQGPLSAPLIVGRARQVTEAAQAARDKIAAKAGQIVEAEDAGELTRQAAMDYIKSSGRQGNTLYRQAEALAGDTRVTLDNTIAELDKHIAEIEQIPGGGGSLNALRSLREELAGEFTVKGVRGMRTELRDRFMGEGLRKTDLERRVGQVLDAAGLDIEGGLTRQGLADAASAYQAADKFWKARAAAIDKVIEPIIGKNGEKSGQKVFAALNSASKHDNAKLREFLSLLPDEDQGRIRATIISRLGQARPGNQNAEGSVFSLSEFLTHWNNLDNGAKATLFPGDLRSSLDDLARVAQGSKEAQRFQNFSNSAGGIAGQAAISGLPWLVFEPVGASLTSIGQLSAAALLSSPRFARWLARLPKADNPRAYAGKLEAIAKADAAIAPQVMEFRNAFLSALNGNSPAQAAASEQEQ